MHFDANFFVKKGNIMKRSRKPISFLLSVLIVLASMPVLFIQATASGALDNPTTAVAESNPFDHPDLFKLNFKHSNNNFCFYQTIDDEYFVVNQDLFLQQYTVSLGDNRTLIFHGINFYEGGSNLADHTDSAAVVEEPAITTNETSEFLSKYYVSDSWTSTHNNTQGLSPKGDVSLQASGYDLNGKHKEYTWAHSVVFKGHSAETSGQIITSYYERATWDWDDGEGNSASMDFRIKTTITVVDAREFAEELAKAQEVLANPDNYSNEYVAAIESMVKDIPADLKDFSGYYSQSIVNAYTDLLQSIPEDVADYSEYNRVLAECRAFKNDGTYSARSYAAYVEQIESINAALPKNLNYSQQAKVDEAVQALLDAKELLVIEFPSTGSTANSDIEDLSPWVENEFNFIQIEDNQVFAYTQSWIMYRGTNSSYRMFYITLDTTDSATSSFAPHFTSDCVATVPTLSAGAIDGTLSNQMIFTNWFEVDANGNVNTSSAAITDGVINPDYSGFKKETVYYLDNGLSFVGMSASESGATTYTYVQKVYVNWTQWQVIQTKNNYATTTYTTTLNITDARKLVAEYNKAVELLENAELHNSQYVAGLAELVSSVPQDMVNGTKYYTQAEVDAYYNAFTSLSETKADYTEYNNAKAEADVLVNDDGNGNPVYTEEAFNAYKEKVESIDKALAKDISADHQDVVDKATQDILDAKAELENNKRADYSWYDDVKSEADSLVNDDGNGNPIYDEDAFNAYKEAVGAVDNALNKDLSSKDQAIVDEAAESLNELKNALDEKMYYTVTYLDADGNVMDTERFVAGTLFSQLNTPALPADTDAYAYLGWLYYGSLAADEDIFVEDAVIQVVREEKTLNVNDEALSIHTATGYITSETRNITAAQLKAMFANDAELLEIYDLEGNLLSDDAFVGTGATIMLRSAYTDAIYEVRTVVVYGDVTGDGLVNADDYSQAKLANINPNTYNEGNYYFFVANDVMADGYIDALDSAYINLMVKGYK